MWKTPWQKLINRSEQIVCYPSPLINIRYLISDEMACVAAQVRRLVGTEHPLLQTAKALIGDTHGVSQLRGLLVLLVSRALTRHSHQSLLYSINCHQRSVAEIVETAHAAISIHKDLVDVDRNYQNHPFKWRYDMQFGNKMATLCGDFLLASVSKALAEFQNTYIVDLISKGIGDTIESIYFPLIINDDENYRKYIYLSNGSLLSKCCKAAVFLRSNETEFNGSYESDGELAENWAIHWCEMYSICENIDSIVQNLSGEKLKSKIFQLKKKPLNPDDFVQNLRILKCRLKDTKSLIDDAHKKFPDYNKQSKEILGEMSELLFQDAISNINLCKVF